MKKIIIVLLLLPLITVAQKQTFDITTYTPPAGWKKETRENIVVYSITDKVKKTWCQLSILKSTASKGSIDADFESEWKLLAATPYSIAEAPQLSPVQEAEGWKIKSGAGKFIFNNADAMAMVTTISGYNTCVSVVATMNTNSYMDAVQKFLESLDLKQPTATDVTKNNTIATNDLGPDNVQRKDGFAFSTCNFDDGWKSTAQEDWVEVSKGKVKVLLHYPKEGTIIPADPEPEVKNAWNILVAPHYSSMKQFHTTYVNDYNMVYIGSAYTTESRTGKNVFTVLFRKGSSGWIEIVTPDKNTFIQEFKFDPETVRWDSDINLFAIIEKMPNYNKFAIAASDFNGKWSSDFTGIQQMYNVYSGLYAGMLMNQSNEYFIFSGNTYAWKLQVVNGMAGNAQYTKTESKGTFSVPNPWQLQCSKIESGPKLYNAFWRCIKGARILCLIDAKYPAGGVYTQYGLSK